MFKTLGRQSRGWAVAGLAAMALLGLSGASSASALGFGGGPFFGVTLNGGWAPFDRCPVDNPTMLSADGVANVALCIAVSGPSGSITIGKMTAPIGGSDTQDGLILNQTEGAETLVPPPGGTLVGSPLALPGGLQALVCPSSSWALRGICRAHPDRFLNTVVARLSSAGAPSDFNLLGGLGVGVPSISLPVKLHLENPLLGEDCSIGTSSEPIVLHPANLSPPTAGAETFDTDGTPDPKGTLLRITLTGASQGDNQLAIPGAHGCGFAGLLDNAIDHNVGLPSPAGNNDLVLNEVTSSLILLEEAVAPNEGKDLAGDWHSAVLHGHGHH